MSSYSLTETRRQVAAVPGDLTAVTESLRDVAPVRPGRVWLCGNGDSRAAALILAAMAPPAYEARVVHPWELSTGTARPGPGEPVVLISASGTSDAIVEAAAALVGSRDTVAVTGNSRGALATGVASAVVWTLGPEAAGKSPAIRTFTATYVALARLFDLLPVGIGWLPPAEAAMATVLSAAADLADRLVADMVAPPAYLATGPLLGAAEFARAKSIEISGVTAVAADPGEWFHIDRHGAGPFGPVVGFSDDSEPAAHLRTALLAAAGQGRRVAVAGPATTADGPWSVLDLAGVPELLRPLAAALAGALVGLRQAELLGRTPFANSATRPGRN